MEKTNNPHLSYGATLTNPETALALLQEQSKHFEQRVVQVSPNVYTAVGFHGANTSMIVGTDGVIIVDTLMGPESATNAMNAFRKYSDKPVKAIIYTHSHGDHTGGAKAFLAQDQVQGVDYDVLGHKSMGGEHGSDTSIDVAARAREVRQFGRKLPPELQTNRGLAPAGTIDHDRAQGHIKPNVMIEEEYKTTIAGVEIEIYHAAGETNDALFLWLPQEKVLLTGDNFYHTFPNLYAIRGTPYRDVRVWANSIARMVTFAPEAIVPGHTSPIIGKEESIEALKSYGEAIQYVFDKTIEGINKGLDPITIAQGIQLPEKYTKIPALTEFYGTVQNSSRAIYAGLLGWFDGNPTNLNPLPKKMEAQKMAKLAGGTEKLMENLVNAMKDEDYQWALMLCDYLMCLDGVDTKAVRTEQISALRHMAYMEYNAPHRNYYHTYANELQAEIQ